MSCEQYWRGHREAFLEEAGKTESDSALLTLYQRLLEQMKANAVSNCHCEETLRQLIPLLFAQASQGAELYLARSLPALERDRPMAKEKVHIVMNWLANPVILCAVLGAGLVYSLLAGGGAWRCALFFAVGLGITLARVRAPKDSEGTISIRTGIRLEYLDELILRQARQLDRQVEDLRTLVDSIATPPDLPLDQTSISLCQYVWAFANDTYPAESALDAVEKLMRNNDLCWVEFSPETRRMYHVLPTRKATRVVYPALKKLSDGTLVAMGQYLENGGGEK